MKHPEIIIYTDGSSLGNPGPGGFGCVIVFPEQNTVVELGGYDRETTNNRMELTAILQSLSFLYKEKISTDTMITIYTDSAYAINGITKWVHGWKKKNWVTLQKTSVLNVDLWKPISELAAYFKKLSFHHVRGHAGVWGNERCDMIATSYAAKSAINLFDGKLSDYDQRILDAYLTPALSYRGEGAIQVSQKKKSSKKSSSEKAYSYVSLLDGKVQTHQTWDQCKARVHGKSAKYKKVFSKGEESALLKEWGK